MAGDTDKIGATEHADEQGVMPAGADHSAAPVAAGHGKELHTGTEAHGGAHNDVGFPPFKPENFAPQLVWLVISFTALYLLMSRLALPRIADIIEERSERIRRDLNTAERLKTETEKALAAYDQALSDARGNASEIATQTRDKLSAEVEGERTRVDEEISAKTAEAEARIGETRQKALSSVNEIAGDVASALVSKLIGGSVSAEELKSAVTNVQSKP